MSVKDDLITKIIQKEIRDRKSKSETKDIIPTSKNSEDDEFTQLLNIMASKIKKKKRKKPKTIQVEYENVSIPAEDDAVKLNTVVTLVDTNVPKKAKKRKRKTSCGVDGNDLKSDVMMPKVKKAKMNKKTAAEDDLQQIFLLEKQDKKRKKKKKKSCDLRIDEIINDYKMMSEIPDSNKTTINTINSNTVEDINENKLLLEKQDKKRKKKKKKSCDLRIDEIINDYKMMSEIPDRNKTTYNIVKSSESIHENTLLLEKQGKKRKKKKKKSCDLRIDEIINDYKMISEIPDSNKTTINAVGSSEGIHENTLPLEKQKKKKKKRKKSHDLSIDETINEYKMISKVPDSNKATINTVESSDDINEKTLLLGKQEKKKKKKKSRDLSIDEIINNYRMKSKVSDSNITTINTVESVDDINENTLLLHESKKNKKKKNEKVQDNNGNPFIQDKDDELSYIEETNISDVPKKLKKKKKQKSCDISYNDMEADSVMTHNVPKINEVYHNLINALISSEDSEDEMKSLKLPKTQKKKKKEKSLKADLTEDQTIPLVEVDALENIRWETARERRPGNDTMEAARNTCESRNGSSFCGCGMCGMSFGCLSGRIKHKAMTLAVTEENRPFECDLYGALFKRKHQLSWHYRTHTVEKPYACDVCGRTFARKYTLSGHHRTHTREKPYSCDVCGKAYVQKSTLYVHYRTHTGEKPYACDVCGKAFTTSTNLIAHYRTHTGEKPYTCDVCGKAFIQKSTLHVHYRTHTGEKPYTCEVCGKMFARTFNLSLHHRTHTGIRPYECGLCEKSFSQKSNYNKHTMIHTRHL